MLKQLWKKVIIKYRGNNAGQETGCFYKMEFENRKYLEIDKGTDG